MAIVDYGSMIQDASKKYNIPANLIAKVMQTESGGNPTAASGTGPVGLMQISRALSKDYGYSPEERLDPAKNIDMGARYLRDNLKAFGGNIQHALLGYNQGTGAARQIISGRKAMPTEGYNYVRNPNFRGFVGEGAMNGTAPVDLHSIANPVAALQESKPDNQFSPALLQRDVAAQAPNQAQAMTGASLPIVVQNAPQEAPEKENQWGNAALAALSMLANRKPKSTTEVGTTGVGRAGSDWNNDTKRVLGILANINNR